MRWSFNGDMINDVTRPDRSFKVRRLHKLFLAWFCGRGNKQTSYNVIHNTCHNHIYRRLSTRDYIIGAEGWLKPHSAVWQVMCWLWLGLKAMGLAWLEVAQACQNSKPGQNPKVELGLAWLLGGNYLYIGFVTLKIDKYYIILILYYTKKCTNSVSLVWFFPNLGLNRNCNWFTFFLRVQKAELNCTQPVMCSSVLRFESVLTDLSWLFTKYYYYKCTST